MNCVNINDPEFQKLADALGNPLLAEIEYKKVESTPGIKSGTDILLGLETQDLEFHINTLNVVSNFLENIGVEQRLVPEFLAEDGSIIKGAIAAANFMKGTVDIIDNLEQRPSAWNKLPEEAAHWWYRLLDKNSELKKALLESGKTDHKESELRSNLYGELPGFKVIKKIDITTGETVITPIREEAIGQLIAEAIKRLEEKNASPADYSFFKKFLEWINSIIDIFKTTNQDPFEVAAMKILSSDMVDLMTWEEYRKLNNIVNFSDVLTEQSVAPLDYTLINDIGFIGSTLMEDAEGNATSGYRFHFKEDKPSSPSFLTQEELDNWVSANIPEHDTRQRTIIQEVRDNQIFFDRLLNKSFRKKSKFLPKTLRKYFQIIDAQNLNPLREWNISQELQQITKKLSEEEKRQIIETNGYTNIAPTLKVLPDLLQKYGRKTTPEIIKQEIEITNKLIKKEITKEQATELRQKLENKKRGNPIVLSESIKIDGAKKQELSILNGIREMIKLENPNLKSITAEEFVAEAHNWLETNYLLGFADEKNYLAYRTDQTFKYVNDRKTDDDIDITTLTEEEIQALPIAERQRIATIVGLTKQNPDVYHNKISLRFNDMSHLKSGHFNLPNGGSPSAWGNLTYFYTGQNKWKDAVLLHEIQNDNIEYLREYKAEKVDLETSLNSYLQEITAGLITNIEQIERGSKRIVKETGWMSIPLHHKELSNLLQQIIDLPLEQGLLQLKQNIGERIELYESDNSITNRPSKAQEEVEKAYSKRRKFANFLKNGGIKSLLSADELLLLKRLLNYLNTDEIQKPRMFDFDAADLIPDEWAVRDGQQKKDAFENETVDIKNKLNTKLQELYGKDAPKITLEATFKPRTKSQIRQGLERSQELNENINYVLAFSEKQISTKLSISIETSKRNYIKALKATNAYNFNKNLFKISKEQYSNLVENFKYNQNLLEKLVDEQAEKDIKLATVNISKLSDEEIIKDITGEFEEPNEIDGTSGSGFVYKNMYLSLNSTTKEEAVQEIRDRYNVTNQKNKQQNQFETLKQEAIEKKEELEKNYGKIEDEVKQTLEVEMNYFTPLVHHLLQKHINQYGKDFPMYFSGYNITKLTQGNDRTAMIYAGKDEINIVNRNAFEFNENSYVTNKYSYIGEKGSFYQPVFIKNNNIITEQEFEKAYQQATEQKAKEIKYEAAVQIGLINSPEKIKILKQEIDEEEQKLHLSDLEFAEGYFNMWSFNSLTDNEKIEHIKKGRETIKNRIQDLKNKLNNPITSLEEGIKKLNEFKKKDKYSLDRVVNTIMNISSNKPIETGAIYNAMTQISGIKLIWQDEIPGLKNNVGGYLVDLTNYNYNVPILYGLENKITLKDKEKEVPLLENTKEENEFIDFGKSCIL